MSSEPKSNTAEATTSSKVSSPKQTSVEMHETAKAKMQEQSDLENSQGFRGKEVDPTDNDAYTVKGVTSGMKTPENDVATRDRVQKELKKRPEQLVGRHHKANETAEKEMAQGFRGVATDETPNENYTVAGVTSGKPTPETDF
jgi:hypothetical protein